MFDKLIYNAKIYTMENESEKYVAMGIKNGKIIKLYDKNPINRYSIAKKIINAKNKTILPGLIDSHVHFMASIAFNEFGFKISEIKNSKIEPSSIEEVKNKVIHSPLLKKKKKLIICMNYITSSIKEKRLPFKNEIDEWLPKRDVIFLPIDGHSCSFSSSLLKKIGINPEGHNGILSGEEHKKNIHKFSDLIKKSLNIINIIHGFQQLINNAIKNGLVGLSCLEGFTGNEKDIVLWLFLKIAPYLPLYLRLYPQFMDIDNLEKITNNMNRNRIGGCGNWEIDGSVSSNTAAFYEEYKNLPGNKGKILYSKKDLLKNIELAYNKKCQITTHAIGTKAIDYLLNVYEKIFLKNNDSSNKLRCRVDHFEFPSKEAVIKAIKKLHLLIVPQPGFIWMDNNFPEMQTYKKNLKQKINELIIPLKTITKYGGTICGSSDSPVQSLNPFIQIHGMVNFPIKKERLSVYEAFRSYTFNGAYTTFEENIRGTIKIGKYADFIILDNDPFKIPMDKLIEINVIETYIKGEKINKYKLNIFSLILMMLFSKKNKL